MRILHSYCLNYNVGDYALGVGLKNLLRHCIDVELIGETNLQGRVFDQYYIETVVNKKYDMLVIGGGGIIHGAHWPQGWFWLIDPAMVDKIKIPFIVYGAGYNYFPGEPGIPQRGVEHLRMVASRARHFSVRNDGSYERLLTSTGIAAKVVPDPGFHVPMDRVWGPSCVKDAFIVLQVAADKADFRFGGAGAQDKFVHEMRRVISELVKKYRVIAIPHVREDVDISKEIVADMAGAEVLRFGDYAFDRCADVFPYYRDAEFVLAMRGHGQIVPLGFRTPVVSFSGHPKVYGIMAALGMEEYHVDIGSEHFAEKIIDNAKKIEMSRPEVVARIDRVITELERLSERAMREIVVGWRV